MKKRLPYIAVFLVLLITEIIIGLYVNDNFIRPYIGDVLVTVLLCAGARSVVPEKPKYLALWVFLFSAGVELIQLLNLPRLLGFSNTVLAVIIGTTFDTADIICYFCGCVIFFFAESAWTRSSTPNPRT